jgi:hypothetical protein
VDQKKDQLTKSNEAVKEAPERKSATVGRIVFGVGMVLLLLGILMSARTIRRRSASRHAEEQRQEFLKQIAVAEPRFEIGYGPIRLDLFQTIQRNSSSAERNLLTYPVVENEVTNRVRTNSPPITPNYDTFKVVEALDAEGFKAAAKRNQLRLREVSVICLIVKQTGKGKADLATLDVYRDALPGALEMYDATDLSGFIDSAKRLLSKPRSEFTRQSLSLGAMDTGSAVIVPLYIANLFDSKDSDLGWQLTSYVVYVPLRIRYTTNQQTEKQIDVKEVLSEPIYFEP